MTPDRPAIGGYHALEATGNGQPLPWRRDAPVQRFRSARAALSALLVAERPTALWLPYFACGALHAAAERAGVPVRRYALGADRMPPPGLAPAPTERVLVIDYFGLGGPAIATAAGRWGSRVVVDAAQALYRAPAAGAATIYSPRKFVGVPDGGWLVGPRGAMAGEGDEAGSRARCAHLRQRQAGDVAAGYASFRAAEASLADPSPQPMSALTSAMLDSMDFVAIGRRRRQAYAVLAGALADAGVEVAPLEGDAVPLCCPVAGVDAPALRAALAADGIFCPDYWPDAVVPADDAVGRRLRERTLYLPCDQRCSDDDMRFVARTLRRRLGR